MVQARVYKALRASVASLCLVVLFYILLLGLLRHTKQQESLFTKPEESSRLRRFVLDNDTFVQTSTDTLSSSPCIQELIPLNDTVTNILRRLNVTDDYVSLVRVTVNFTDGDLPDDAEQDSPAIWHWGLGGRGRTMLHFPYDNRSLSLKTLSFGVHSVHITLDNTVSQNESFSDECFVYVLSKILRQVRLKLENSASASDDFQDDVICKERFLASPSFAGTLIPGYSLFDLQSSSYYQCWNVRNINACDKDNCIDYPSFTIYCKVVNIAFGITYGLLAIALIYELWRIYSRAYNYEDENLEERVNILRINLIPPVLLMLASNNARHHKIFHYSYWAVVYSIPFIIYLVAFLWYVTRVDEYAFRSTQRGGKYTETNAWGLDFALANIMYIDGAVVFLYFIHKYRLENPELFQEKPFDWKSKRGRLLWYSAVVVLCFFRFSASAMLIVEIFVLTAVGIAINIRYGTPIWINVILSGLYFAANIIQFFDSYQHLLSKIQSVGTKVDRDENLPYKIFEQTDDGSPQLRFKIRSNLLRDIIRKWLPLHSHLFNTIFHIVVGIAFLAVVAGIVVVIDRTTKVSSLVEYVITAIPLIIAAAGKFGGSPLTAGGKAKNKALDKLLKLEGDLREYGRTGEFPGPDASCWRSFWSCMPCNTGEQDLETPASQEQRQNQDPVTPSTSTNQDQPQDHQDPSVSNNQEHPQDQGPHAHSESNDPCSHRPQDSAAIAVPSSPTEIDNARDRTSIAASSLSTPPIYIHTKPSSPMTDVHVQIDTQDGGHKSSEKDTEASL